MLIGDLGTPHTTGSHLVRALHNNGHVICQVNERPEIWAPIGRGQGWLTRETDLVVWNSTPGYAPEETYDDQRTFLRRCKDAGIPTVGYHLDLYWSLPEREHWVKERPFFRSDLVVTADGGHPEEWEKAGVDHVWFPPAVLGADCTPGVFRAQYASDIAFVGSWSGGYHRESAHRMELVGWLKGTYGARCKFWPPRARPRVVGQDLNDLYASTKVVVGDSCMVPHLSYYWSDRIPETTGRGAYLLHPYVEGLEEQHRFVDTWRAGEWPQLQETIEDALADRGHRLLTAADARKETLEHHTYEVRVRQLVELLEERKLT